MQYRTNSLEQLKLIKHFKVQILFPFKKNYIWTKKSVKKQTLGLINLLLMCYFYLILHLIENEIMQLFI